MVKRSINDDQFKLPRGFWVILVVIGVVIVGSLSWFAIWRTEWPDYIQAVNKCGGKPPIEASAFITRTYSKPEDMSYKVPAGGMTIFYCTEQEAISAGFKRAIN